MIADISFRTLTEMRSFAASVGDLWEEEPYWLADRAKSALAAADLACTYEQISPCGGVYCIEQA